MSEKQEADFFSLKKEIEDEFDINSNDDIKEDLKRILALETEIFNISLNDIVLKRYYEYFMEKVYPLVLFVTKKNSKFDGIDTLSLPVKGRINEENRNAIKLALADYALERKDDYLLSKLNSHEVLLSNELREVMNKKDIFQRNSNLNKDIQSKYAEIKYNYSYSFWQGFGNVVMRVIESLEKRLSSKIPDFAENIKTYEYHISLYKRFLEAEKYLNNSETKEAEKCQK